jgi:hypothetical protein
MRNIRKKTNVNNCRAVVILLINDGLILYGMDMIDMMAIPRSIIKSLLMTITVNHPGIIPFIDRVTKQLARRALSAMGSKYAPSTVCWFNTRARKPSRASVIPETTRTISAFVKFPCMRKITVTGTRRILNSVNKLGIFIYLLYPVYLGMHP